MQRDRWPLRFRMALVVLVAAGLLAGCWDRNDPEKMAWVTAIGIDKGPENDFIFSFQVPATGVAQQQGTGGGQQPGQGAGGGGGVEVFSIRAPDIITAMDASQAFVARRISLTHTKAVIVGEEVAREDVTPVIAAATRYYEFRRNMGIMVSRGTAADFLQHAQPRLEAHASRWYELLMLTQSQAGIVPESRIHEFVIETEMPGVGAKATLVAVRPDVAAGEEELDGAEEDEASVTPPPAGRAKAGGLRRAGEIPVEFIGAAIFKGGRLVGFLSGDESRFLSMLRAEFRHATMAFVDPNSPDRRLVLRLTPEDAPDLQVMRQGARVRAKFTVKLEGDLLSVQSDTDYAKAGQLQRLEASVSRELEKRIGAMLGKTLNEWGTDIYRIGNKLRPTFATVQEWEGFGWGKRVQRTEYSVEVRLQVRRYGLQARPALPEE